MVNSLKGDFQFRVLKSSWGIWINLAGSMTAREIRPRTDGYEFIYDTVAFRIESSSREIREYAVRGIHRMRDLIDSSFPGGVVVDITKLEFPNSDFQVEAIEFAVVEWIAKLLGMPAPSWTVTFFKDENRYHFSYEKHEEV